MSLTSDNTKRAFPILDTILEMQRFGLRAMTLYQPVASAFLDLALSAERGATSSFFVSPPRDRTVGEPARQDADAEHVVAIGEEVLTVGTRTVRAKRRASAVSSSKPLCSRTSLCIPRRSWWSGGGRTRASAMTC